jgi:predicted amidohydrolase
MKFNKFKAAAIQMNSGEEVQVNLDTAVRLIGEAAKSGAQVVAVPENFLYIGPDKSRCFSKDGEEINLIRDLAKEKEIIIVAGSIREKTPDAELPYNVCYVIAPDGSILEEYRKIHLFDVDLPTGEKYRESEEVAAGSEVKVLDTSFGKFGLTICYDLRFPELYRKLALKGAQTIFVPSNFTLHTGKDHWLTLVQSRAIENTCYIVAPAQIGHKFGLRASFGKSVIVDPWGSILAKAPDKDEAVVMAEIDLDYLKKVRQALPSLNHIKLI